MNAAPHAGDSTVAALQSSGRGKIAALAVLLVLFLSSGAYFLLSGLGSRGEPDEADQVLIVGPEAHDLAGWLNGRGFGARQMSYAAAVSAGQELEPGLEGLAAIAVFADEHGYGYLAIHPPEIHEFDAMAGEEVQVPTGATVAVIAIGDQAEPPRVTFGVPSLAVAHEAPAAQQVGLFLGLFEQPALARIQREEIDSSELDAYNDFGEQDTLNRYRTLVEAQRKFDKIATAWNDGAPVEDPPLPTAALGGPFEKIDAYPLADGGILSLVGQPGWHTEDGYRAQLAETEERVARYLTPGDVEAGKGGGLEAAGKPCGPTDATGIHAIRVADRGDSLALQRFISDGGDAVSGSWAVQFIKFDQSLAGCPFAIVGYPLQSRQMYELGPPHPAGAMLMVSDRLRFGFNARERSWNYPILSPDGGAAAWVDGTLVAYGGGPRYGDSAKHGLAFMSALTENRIESFFPMRLLVPDRDAEPLNIEHVKVMGPDRFLLVVGDRQRLRSFLVEVEFTKPVRTTLLPVDHTGNLPKQLKRVTATSRSGIKSRVLVDPLPDYESASFDREGTLLAYAHNGQAMLVPLDDPSLEPTPLSPAGQRVTDVRIAPDGKRVIYHRTVTISETEIRTANVVWLD